MAKPRRSTSGCGGCCIITLAKAIGFGLFYLFIQFVLERDGSLVEEKLHFVIAGLLVIAFYLSQIYEKRR